MHDLLLQRNIHDRIFKRLNATIKSLLNNEFASSRTIEKRLNELTERWIKLQEAHDHYVLSSFSDTCDINEQDTFIETLSLEFYETESECEKHLVAENKLNPICKAPDNGFKIERFKFPIFDGHVRKYPKFKYEFNKFIKPLCLSKQLPFALKNYLCESVRRDVENFDHDIDLMWNRLDEKFGAKQKLIDSIISDIKQLPEINNTPQQTLKMIHTIESANSDLKCVNSTDELNNAAIISMIEQRMNSSMHNEWVKLVINIPHSDRFETLLTFLSNWKTRIEYQNANIRLPTNESAHPEIECQNTNIRLPSKESAHPMIEYQNANIRLPVKESTELTDRKCLIHRDCHHPVWRCRAFLSLSVPERLNIVRSSNACTLCLDTGHDERHCSKVSQCSRYGCSQRHNILLHKDD